MTRWPLEVPTASLEVTRPLEIELYARMFDRLRASAVYGKAARGLVAKAMDDLGLDSTFEGN